MKIARFTCGLEAALSVIGGKWKPLILYHLASERQRFGALRRLVAGVSEKVLIQQLKELQADGIVAREDFKEVPPRVEYSLTPFGETLAKALGSLCEWGTAHQREISAIADRRDHQTKNEESASSPEKAKSRA